MEATKKQNKIELFVFVDSVPLGISCSGLRNKRWISQTYSICVVIFPVASH